jgi:hypothetical protein
MSTYNFDLLFLPSPANALPGPPISHIQVKTFTKCGYTGVPDRPTITPQCMTFRELSAEVDRLIGELEEIRREANAKYLRQEAASG